MREIPNPILWRKNVNLISKFILVLSFVLAVGQTAEAQTTCSLTTLTNGTTADATAVMGNFNTLWNCVNSTIVGASTVSGGNVGIGISTPTQKLSVGGVIQSTTGGVQFPDGTIQSTAATGSTRVLLNTLTASGSSTLQDTTSITSAYPDYEIVFENLVPATTGATCLVQLYVTGALQTTGYLTGLVGWNSGGTTGSSASNSGIFCSYPNDTYAGSAGISGTLKIYNANNTSVPKNIIGTFSHAYTASENVGIIDNGYWNGGNGTITGISVAISSGLISSGAIKIYGLK